MSGWDDQIFANLPRGKPLPGSPKRPKFPDNTPLFPVDPREVIGGLMDQGAQGVGHAIDRVTGQPVGEGFSQPTLGREAYQMLTSPTFGGGMSPMAGAGATLAAVPLAARAARAAKGARTAEEIAAGATDADAAAQASRAAQASPGQAALDQMTSGQPREFYRGTNPGDQRRIATGDAPFDSHLFASANPDDASMYGRDIAKLTATPDAKILYEGTPDWQKIAGGQRQGENLLSYASRAAQAAKDAGYDAAHFTRQGDVGTAIFNPDKFPAFPGATPGIGHNQGPAMPAPPSATDIATGRRTMADVPDIRGMPLDQALETAKSDPHLIVAGKGSPGYYVGGPASIKSPEDLAAMRAQLDAQIKAGMKGSDWYDRGRAGEQRATGGDPATNDFMAQAHGTWSQGVNPESETAFAMKEIASRAAGQPQRAMYQNQSDAFNAAIDADNPALAQTGKKTGQYAAQINANQPNPEGATGVNDFRMGQEMGFKNADAALRAGEFSLSPSQHTFMDYETANAVRRANAANLGGRSTWTGPQIQASPWTIQKAGALMDQRPSLAFDDAFAEANKVPQDFYPKHAVNITYEHQPARMLAETGHMPTANQMTQQQMTDFANDPRASFASAPSAGLQPGELPRDIIYGGQQARIGGSSMGYPTLPTLSGTGYFKNKLGEIEGGQPVFIARPLTGFDSAASLPSDIAQTIKEGRAAKGAPASGPFSLMHGDDGIIPLGQATSAKDIASRIAKNTPLDPSKPMTLTSNLNQDLGTWDSFDPQGTTTLAGTLPGNKRMLPASKAWMETGEETRAYVLGQEGIGGHKLWFDPTPSAVNGYHIKLDRNATPEEMDALSKAGIDYDMPHVTSTAGGLLVTNFDKNPALTAAHRKAIPGALAGAAPEGAGAAEGVKLSIRFTPGLHGARWAQGRRPISSLASCKAQADRSSPTTPTSAASLAASRSATSTMRLRLEASATTSGTRATSWPPIQNTKGRRGPTGSPSTASRRSPAASPSGASRLPFIRRLACLRRCRSRRRDDAELAAS